MTFEEHLEADFAAFEEWRSWSATTLASYIVTQRAQWERSR